MTEVINPNLARAKSGIGKLEAECGISCRSWTHACIAPCKVKFASPVAKVSRIKRRRRKVPFGEVVVLKPAGIKEILIPSPINWPTTAEWLFFMIANGLLLRLVLNTYMFLQLMNYVKIRGRGIKIHWWIKSKTCGIARQKRRQYWYQGKVR